MLELYAVPQLEQEDAEVIFQHDGAPQHYTATVREFLDATFPQWWIGRGGWLPWPQRSPDLTPLHLGLGQAICLQCSYQRS
jgi:hypothetical protein